MDHLQDAWRTLKQNRKRSFLTVLSIVGGAFSIVFMSSLAKAGLQTIAQGIESIGGARYLLIDSQGPEREAHRIEDSKGFSSSTRDTLTADIPEIENASAFAVLGPEEVRGINKQSARSDLVAVDEYYFPFMNFSFLKGRTILPDEFIKGDRVCVVGDKLGEELFRGKEFLGRQIQLQGVSYRIVGQFDSSKIKEGVNFGFNWERAIFIPLPIYEKMDPEVARQTLFQIRTRKVSDNDVVKRIVNARLVQSHAGVDDFKIWDFAGMLAQFYNVFRILNVLVGFLAGIALIVGGVGIMNMMWASVAQRIKEIGIRKALGASKKDIELQFLSESVLLTSIGGGIGVSLGVLASLGVHFLIQYFSPNWISSISGTAIALALFVCFLVGVGFGVVPAKKAGRLSPVTAMRTN